MIKIKKWHLVLAICALILCITQIQQTYAKYLDTKEGDTDFTIAKWKILVNQQDITEASTMSSLINPVYIENEHMKEGVIAPGREGYFDLVIDSSNTEVSFRYDISVTSSENSSVNDLVITGYSLNDSEIIPVSDQLNNLSNIIYYTDTNKENKIRIYFQWRDGTGENMNNEADTNASIQGVNAKLKASITFTQITN